MPGPPGEKGESGHVGSMVSTAQQPQHIYRNTHLKSTAVVQCQSRVCSQNHFSDSLLHDYSDSILVLRDIGYRVTIELAMSMTVSYCQ